MKWRQVGQRLVQLRLSVALVGGEFFLCRAYAKLSDSVDKREMAKLKIHLRDLALGRYKYRGDL